MQNGTLSVEASLVSAVGLIFLGCGLYGFGRERFGVLGFYLPGAVLAQVDPLIFCVGSNFSLGGSLIACQVVRLFLLVFYHVFGTWRAAPLAGECLFFLIKSI